jgi:hypothetical protein
MTYDRLRPPYRALRIALLSATLPIVAGCGGGDASTTPDVGTGSFANLQTSVFNRSCAVSGCHVSGATAPAGNLVLTAGQSYQNLINAIPTNLNARRDGVRRVVPFKSDSSLLYQKIIVAGGAHNGEYGNIMPLGNQPLTVGQLEFIRRWIDAGAPKTGEVVEAELLDNQTPQISPDFTPLAPPPAGTGVQLRVDAFDVTPNFERELFVYRGLGNAQPIYVNRIETSMRALSHHFVLYAFDPSPNFPCNTGAPEANKIRDIRNADGTPNIGNMLPMACHVFVGGSMNQRGDYIFPPGVALELPAQMGIDVNVHYVNRTASRITGEAYANLYTIAKAQVQRTARTLNWGNTNISLAPFQRRTLEKTFTVSQPTTIFALTSHMHALGEKFQIEIVGGARNGEVVYESTDWEHPAMLSLTTPIVLQAGQGLKSIITWNNTTSRTVTFGLLSTDEMGIVFGYYY